MTAAPPPAPTPAAAPPCPEPSPTGKPLVDPKYVPALGAVWALLASLSEMAPEGSKAKRFIHLALLTLGPLLGMATPGLRRNGKAPTPTP